jgi:hypothetical protein
MRVHTAADTVRDAAQRPLERLCERPYAKKNKTQPAAPGIEIFEDIREGETYSAGHLFPFHPFQRK